MQLLVGPYALSGMNRIVSGLAGMGLLLTRLVLTASGPAVLPEGCHVLRGRVHRPARGSPIHDQRSFPEPRQSPGDLEYEPWRDGASGGYRSVASGPAASVCRGVPSACSRRLSASGVVLSGLSVMAVP